MSTARTPLRLLKEQADEIARKLKAIERGETVTIDHGGKVAASLASGRVKVGVVMDDAVITIEMAWSDVKNTSEVALAAYVLKTMRRTRETHH